MDGRDHIREALESGHKVKSGMEAKGVFKTEPVWEELVKALTDLEGLKNKPSLRTKDGTNLALPVMEAARELEAAWEGAGTGGDELKTNIEQFVDAVNALAGALKARTVIMT